MRILSLLQGLTSSLSGFRESLIEFAEYGFLALIYLTAAFLGFIRDVEKIVSRLSKFFRTVGSALLELLGFPFPNSPGSKRQYH